MAPSWFAPAVGSRLRGTTAEPEGANSAPGQLEHGSIGPWQRHVADSGYDAGPGETRRFGFNEVEDVAVVEAIPGHLYKIDRQSAPGDGLVIVGCEGGKPQIAVIQPGGQGVANLVGRPDVDVGVVDSRHQSIVTEVADFCSASKSSYARSLAQHVARETMICGRQSLPVAFWRCGRRRNDVSHPARRRDRTSPESGRASP